MSGRPKPWPRRKPHSSAKVPEPSPETLRLYTIPPPAPFLAALAKAVLDGALPSPGRPKPDPLSLPLTIGYVSLLGFAVIAPVSWAIAPVGARLAHALDRRRLSAAFGVFLLIVGARMLYRALA